ncbi:hypothetical protein [Plantactinospora sp. B5E13]|uniref:hypothetical protein n=1 Tax=unclassified Plantactinospora TaxID=2631981 RepID=UPI00325EDC10
MALEVLLMAGMSGGSGDQESRRRAVRRRIRETVAVRRACAEVSAQVELATEPGAEVAPEPSLP